MNNRIDAIYARQSVDKKDSISIESQIEFCKYELKGGNCKEYTDKGYSGKNTDRPKFQELVRDIKRGLIAKVVVYKLDRISRSILDFANMMELFQQYNVEFVSSTEKFDTSTPMGRAMLNICIVFAQLERETIQKRVTDAYYSRSQRGFKMGGKAPYGFHTEPIKMDGINTKKLVVNPDEAANIRLMFEMYAQPTTSYGDITRHFAEQGILFNGKELIRPTLAQMLRNPVYVQELRQEIGDLGTQAEEARKQRDELRGEVTAAAGDLQAVQADIGDVRQMHGRSRRKALTKRIELPEDDYARLLKLAESAAGLQVENRHLVQELQNSGTMLWRLRREAEDTEERLHQLWMDTRSYREAVKIAPRRVNEFLSGVLREHRREQSVTRQSRA